MSFVWLQMYKVKIKFFLLILSICIYPRDSILGRVCVCVLWFVCIVCTVCMSGCARRFFDNAASASSEWASRKQSSDENIYDAAEKNNVLITVDWKSSKHGWPAVKTSRSARVFFSTPTCSHADVSSYWGVVLWPVSPVPNVFQSWFIKVSFYISHVRSCVFHEWFKCVTRGFSGVSRVFCVVCVHCFHHKCSSCWSHPLVAIQRSLVNQDVSVFQVKCSKDESCVRVLWVEAEKLSQCVKRMNEGHKNKM